jgi:hypothetical protein
MLPSVELTFGACRREFPCDHCSARVEISLSKESVRIGDVPWAGYTEKVEALPETGLSLNERPGSKVSSMCCGKFRVRGFACCQPEIITFCSGGVPNKPAIARYFT